MKSKDYSERKPKKNIKFPFENSPVLKMGIGRFFTKKL